MPWSNQSGGPWGPKNQKPQGPWGGGPQGGPPDLEDMLRRGQDRLRGIMPGGGGSIGGRGILVIVAGAIALWLATGFYTVRPDEVGINMIFGRYVGKTGEGLRYNFPYPIGRVLKPKVTTVNTTEVGLRSTEATLRRINQRNVLEESLMLTGDENIVDIDFSVQWQVNPAKAEDYVFNLQNPDAAIKAVAESAMREVVGRRNIQAILTTDRAAIEAEVKTLMQDTLNHYGAGVEIRLVQLQKVDPPQQVIDAFRDVQAARQDQDRVRNEAETYASQRVPEARGRAIGIVQAAEAYKEQAVNEAQGNASRFNAVYEQYRKAPDVTRERIYLETMERIFGNTDKVILSKGGQGVLPYLPLDQMKRRPAADQTQGAAQ